MDYDKSIRDDNLLIYCSNDLSDFANNFIDYYKNNIDNIKSNLDVIDNDEVIVAITSDKELANFQYGESAFSGFFTDTGAFAYINLNKDKKEDYMLRGLMHELVHYYYKKDVYKGERNTWLDEGLAVYLSNQYKSYDDIEDYNKFINNNINESNINIDLNNLLHDDKSFNDNNGYKLSLIAVKYLIENNTHEDFINIIKDNNKIKSIGKTIINDAYNYYNKQETLRK